MKRLALNRRTLLAALGLAPVAATARAAAPARAPVKLLWTRVNGEAYYQAAKAAATLAVGDPVRLRREPTNAYDKRAIEVFDTAGRKLGYVARMDNSAVARMMDAGEHFQARVSRLDRATLDIRLDVEWLPG